VGLFGNSQKVTRLNHIRVTESILGIALPIVIGQDRLSANLIWYGDFQSHPVSAQGGKGVFGKGANEYSYTASIIAALCSGPISGIASVWDTSGKFVLESATESYTVPEDGGTYTVSNAAAFGFDQGVGAATDYSFDVSDFGNPAGPVTLAGNYQLPFTPVTGTPTGGQYASDGAGNYTFSSSDAGKVASIAYVFYRNYLETTEVDLIPASGPYTVTVQNGGSSGTFKVDHGVTYQPSGIAFEAVSSSPTTGQYSESNGVYTFAGGDAGEEVAISYEYADPNPDQNAPTQLNLTVFNGLQSQDPWSYVSGAHPTEALGYTNTAYVASSQLYLGVSGELPNYNYEVLGYYLNQVLSGSIQMIGGPSDANPFCAILDLLTGFFNPLIGIGYPLGAIDLLSWYENQNSAYLWWAANSFFISTTLRNQASAASVIGPWLEASQVAAVFSEGILKFIPYGDTSVAGNGALYQPTTGNQTTYNEPVVDLDDDDFLQDDPKNPKDPITVTRKPYYDAFNRVQVEYSNRSNEYAAETIYDEDPASVEQYGNIIEPVTTWDFIKTYAAAFFAANLRVKRYVYINNTYQFSLRSTFSFIEPMDIVTVTDATLGWVKNPIRIISVEDDPKKGLSIVAEEFPWGTATATLYPKISGGGYAPIYATADPGDTSALVFEAPDRLAKQQGNTLYVFCNSSNNPNWGGCDVYVSLDPGDFGSKYATVTNPARIGHLTADLPSAADPDTTDTLSVSMAQSGAVLTSVSEASADSYVSLSAIVTLSEEDPFTILQTAVGQNNGTSVTAAFTDAPITEGSLILVCFSGPNDLTDPVISDDNGNVYDYEQIIHSTLTGVYAEMTGAQGCNAGDTTVTAEIGSGSGQLTLVCHEIAGVWAADSGWAGASNAREGDNDTPNIGSEFYPYTGDTLVIGFVVTTSDATPFTAAAIEANYSSGAQLLSTSQYLQGPGPGGVNAFWSTASPGSWVGAYIALRPQQFASDGFELISYANAALSGSNQYDLTYLRRGVYGSTINDHPAGSAFARLDEASFQYQYPSEYYGKTIYLKFCSFNLAGKKLQALSDVAQYHFTLQGVGPGAIDIATGIYRPGYGSTPSSWVGSMTYASTTTSVTWTWGITIYRGTVPKPTAASSVANDTYSGSQEVTGLTPGDTYNFFPYLDDIGGTGVNFINSDEVVDGATGTPAIAYGVSVTLPPTFYQGRNDRIPLSTGPVAVSVPSSGTGGGSGGGAGGACPRADMILQTRDRGNIRADRLIPGEWISAGGGVWVQVTKVVHAKRKDWIEVTTQSGESFVGTDMHPWPMIDGGVTPSNQLTLNSAVLKADGTPTFIESIRIVRGESLVVKIEVNSESHLYAVGAGEPNLLAHNGGILPTTG
jgi:hypothetical protein